MYLLLRTIRDYAFFTISVLFTCAFITLDNIGNKLIDLNEIGFPNHNYLCNFLKIWIVALSDLLH